MIGTSGEKNDSRGNLDKKVLMQLVVAKSMSKVCQASMSKEKSFLFQVPPPDRLSVPFVGVGSFKKVILRNEGGRSSIMGATSQEISNSPLALKLLIILF